MLVMRRQMESETPSDHEEDHPSARAAIEALRLQLNAALLGKSEVVELVLAGLLAQGHILIEDLPGLGKTTLAKALADGVGGRFARVQCTPDLLPTDITGFNMFNQRTREFEFVPGPVFCDVLLADEINRATPRTQSALFEAMAERQVTIDGVTRPLAPTFFVIATQNPLESHGVYPLPEAQLDRFSLKLHIGYPDAQSETEMLALDGATTRVAAQKSPAPIDPAKLASLQARVSEIYLAPQVREYIVKLGAWTRQHKQVHCGLSPRALLAWQRLAKAWAFLHEREFVLPDDVQFVAGPVVEMRLIGEFDTAGDIVRSMLAEVPVPVSLSHSTRARFKTLF